MKIELLAPDKEMLERMMEGCAKYGLKAKFNKRTCPYVHVEIHTPEDVVHIFWLGANLAHPKIKHPLIESSY